MSEDPQEKLISKMGTHNTTQLEKFFEGSDIGGDWQLVFAASYNGCIISLPAKGGGQMRMRVAARYMHEQPYLELRTERMGGSDEEKGEEGEEGEEGSE